jgi:hypothetical protein
MNLCYELINEWKPIRYSGLAMKGIWENKNHRGLIQNDSFTQTNLRLIHMFSFDLFRIFFEINSVSFWGITIFILTVKETNVQNLLKGTLARNFWLLFFSSKAPSRSPNSCPKFVSTIKSNSQRYSNYSSLSVDSVNLELIFCFTLHTNF